MRRGGANGEVVWHSVALRRWAEAYEESLFSSDLMSVGALRPAAAALQVRWRPRDRLDAVAPD